MRSRLLDQLRRSALEGTLAPAAAVFDHLARPAIRESFSGPLNGQAFRRLIVEGVMSACGLRAVVETGSFRGTTTEFFASRDVESVFTVECMPRFYWYTRLRFLLNHTVKVMSGDSRKALLELARDPGITRKPTLFYLDAHWGADLPLGEEIKTIAASWQRWVAVVDDFKVPDDAGYGFDSYGVDATLDAGYCARIGIPGMRLFYPALESRLETGWRRGCVVLTNVVPLITELEKLTALLHPAA